MTDQKKLLITISVFVDMLLLTYRFLAKLLTDDFKLLGLIFHLLALLVIVDSQLLQSLQHFLHLLLGGLVLRLQAVQLSLKVLMIAPGGSKELQECVNMSVLKQIFIRTIQIRNGNQKSQARS